MRAHLAIKIKMWLDTKKLFLIRFFGHDLNNNFKSFLQNKGPVKGVKGGENFWL